MNSAKQNTTANKTTERPARPSDWVKSPKGVTEGYVNAFHFGWTLDDIRLRLGQLVADENECTVAEERITVTFSWRNALKFRNSLSDLIRAFEKVNGPIRDDLILPESGDADSGSQGTQQVPRSLQ